MHVIIAFMFAFALLGAPAARADDAGVKTFFLSPARSSLPDAVTGARSQGRASLPSDQILRLITRQARLVGVPVEIALDHARRESGYRCAARNPRSSATGLFQLIDGSAAAIAGRAVSRAERMDCALGARLGLAHIRACMDLMPGASSLALWRRCHVGGHARVGGNIHHAAKYFHAVTGSL